MISDKVIVIVYYICRQWDLPGLVCDDNFEPSVVDVAP